MKQSSIKSSSIKSPNMKPSLNFSGKTALIMGASRGIGLATARLFVELGANVFMTGRSMPSLSEAADAINAQTRAVDPDQSPGKATALACDVSDYASVQSAVDQCLQQAQRIDFLVNNAGVIDPLTHLIDSDPQQWALAVDVNFKGVYHSMRAVLPHMVAAGGGVVVNMSSGAANSDLPGWSHYCSTKAAAKKLTEVAHRELHEDGIRIVGLSPGTVATDMMAKIRDAKINVVSNLDWSTHIPSEWAAQAVAFLCGPEGEEFAGTDFSIKTSEGRERVGLPVS